MQLSCVYSVYQYTSLNSGLLSKSCCSSSWEGYETKTTLFGMSWKAPGARCQIRKVSQLTGLARAHCVCVCEFGSYTVMTYVGLT